MIVDIIKSQMWFSAANNRYNCKQHSSKHNEIQLIQIIRVKASQKMYETGMLVFILNGCNAE